MQMRFTDTHTVFIFILVSFYRTFLRFPHRLTIPAYKIRSHCITCIICFLWEIYRLPDAGTIYWSHCRSWAIESLTPLSCVTFLLPSLYVQSFKHEKACVTGYHFSLRLVYALMTTWAALTGCNTYFSFPSRLNITFLFEKQLTAFNNEESVVIAWHSVLICICYPAFSYFLFKFSFRSLRLL